MSTTRASSSRRIVERWRTGPLNPSQRDLLRWEPPADADRFVCGSLSAGYGSGKTWGGACKFTAVLMAAPGWRQGVELPPRAAVVCPSFPTLGDSIIPMLDMLMPESFIVSKHRSTPIEWKTRHGWVIRFYSGKGITDSFSCALMWVDEVSYPEFLGPEQWRRLTGRLRWKGRRKGLIVSGIAEMHPALRERFHRPNDPRCHIVMPGIRENRALTEEDIQDKLALVPFEAKHAVEHGGWVPVADNVYAIDEKIHRWKGVINKALPCSVGYDPGKKACAVVGQQYKDVFVLVDEVIGTDIGSEGLMRMVQARGWTPQTIVLDTQASPDTWPQIQSVFPNAFPVQQVKRSAAWRVEHGIQHTQWALQSATGVTRLQIADHLWKHGHPERGVVLSLAGYKRGESGTPKKDNKLDHQCDAVRMLAMAMIERPEYEGRNNYADAYTEVW